MKRVGSYPIGVRRVAALFAGATCLALADPAEALNVTIGSITYDLQVQSAGQSYLGLQSSIETSPWWTSDGSSQATAFQFADAYLAAAGPTDTPLFFAYSEPSPAFISYGEPTGGFFGDFDLFQGQDAYSAVVASGTQSDASPLGITDTATTTGPYSGFRIVTGTEVPEINGSVLARLFLVMGVLYLGLAELRRRRRHSCATA